MVCKSKQALYGLKQAPRAWYARLDKYLLQQGYKKGNVDSNIYLKVEGDQILILVVYVDEIIFGGNEEICKKFAEEMQNEFEMSIFWEIAFFLGLQISQSERVIFITQ